MNGRHLPGRARTDLLGRTILLVEDDFCQARDTQQALQHAGAKVIGPFADAESALRSIAARDPTFAILDIRLTDGVCFNIASALMDKGIPFMFLTALDPKEIPADLATAPIMQKPMDIRSMLTLAARLSGGRWD